MRQRETLKREYYGEQDGEIWVANMSKYTRWDEGYEGPYCELYIDPTGTSVLKSYTDLAEPIPYMVFEILKGIENPHLVKLQRRFYCRFKDADIEKLQTRPTLVPIDAYSRKNIREQRIEILKRDKLDYVFQSLSIIAILPVLFISPLKNWSISNFSFTKQFYDGKLGLYVQIALLMLTFL